MNVLRFNSTEEMQAYLIRAKTDALMGMHPLQSRLTYGDYWVRFVDLANKIVEFGHVASLQQVADQAIDSGATTEQAADEVDQAELLNVEGFLTGYAYSPYNRNGEWGVTHKSNVWPIEESLFLQAGECNYHLELLPISGKINLEVAFRGYRKARVAARRA